MKTNTNAKSLEFYYKPKRLRDLILFILSVWVAITSIISNIHNMLK